VLSDQLADGSHEIARHSHDRLAWRREGRYVLSGSLVLRLRLVAGQDLFDSLFVPSRREAGLGIIRSTSAKAQGTISSFCVNRSPTRIGSKSPRSMVRTWISGPHRGAALGALARLSLSRYPTEGDDLTTFLFASRPASFAPDTIRRAQKRVAERRL